MTIDATMADHLVDRFRQSMRGTAASVSIVSTRDEDGKFHGMAVTSATSLSMEPPSMMVAIKKSASLHPVISATGRFCLNLLADDHGPLVEHFSRSDLRHKRFEAGDWQSGPGGLPVLASALSAQVCTVVAAHDFGSHTVFFGRVDDLLPGADPEEGRTPLVWLNGSCATVRPTD